MALVIPDGFANWVVSIDNNGAGLSARSSIALGTDVLGGQLTQTDVDRIANLYRDNLKTLWDNQWEVGPIKVYEGTSAGLRVHDSTTQEPGTASADTYSPPQIAHVITKNTGFVGKKFRGRFFLPGVPDGFAGEDGGINPTRVTEVQNALIALATALVADAKIEILFLFHDSESPGDSTPTPITSLVCRDYQGTVRLRNRAV